MFLLNYARFTQSQKKQYDKALLFYRIVVSMKKLIPLFFFTGNFYFAVGQVTSPIVKANFGIEADLSSNYFNAVAQPGTDDWFENGYPEAGDFIIDTSGAADILAGYLSNPATRTMTFSRLMRYPSYQVINNTMLLDAVFQRDFHGDDSTVYASGSNKNGMSPVSWNCPVSQGVPDKNDILDAFTHVRRAGINVTDSLWMFAGISIENTTGSRYFDFELYQTNLVYNRTTQTFTGYGLEAGHTTWKFDAAGNITSPGDIIFTAEFNNAGLSLVEARIWINKAELSILPSTFSWGGDFDGDGNGAVYGYANILPKTLGDFYTGIQNGGASTWAGPFGLVRVDNSVVNSYLPKQFMEFSVNLTKLGIEPASFSNNGCGSPFRRVLVKTRSSTSFTSELKDFIAPFNMFDYQKIDANAFVKYFCATMPNTTVQIYNPLATSVYTWSTSNGNIVGDTVGTMININAPGTYTVRQQLHSQCPVFAIDSVSILYDSICAVLNVNVTGFNATSLNSKVVMKWQSSNNEQATTYVLEYSYDNINFSTLDKIAANAESGTVDYSSGYLQKSIAATIFYRIKIIGKNQLVKYSNTVVLRPTDFSSKARFIFPNPIRGEAKIFIESSEQTEVYIYLSDISGRVIKAFKIQVKQGNNIVSLPELTDQSSGVYVVKIKSIDGETIQKLVLNR